MQLSDNLKNLWRFCRRILFRPVIRERVGPNTVTYIDARNGGKRVTAGERRRLFGALLLSSFLVTPGLSGAQMSLAPLVRSFVTNVSSAGISAAYPLYITWSGTNVLTDDLQLLGSTITFTNPGAIVNPNYVQFNTAWADGSAVGRLQWNNTDGTLEFGALGGDVNIQIGQETVVYARNATGAAILNGSVVRIKGETGGKPSIELADANDAAKDDHILGIATENIDNNDNGYVTSFGLVRGLNTNAFAAGDELYLSETAGAFTNVAPSVPSKIIHVGHVIVKSPSDGVVLATIDEVTERTTFGDIYADRVAVSTGNFSGYGVAIGTPVFFADGGEFWDDVRFPLSSASGATIRPPTLKQFRRDAGATTDGLYFYAFEDEAVAGNEEELFGSIQMPHGWKQGSAIEPHLHFSVTASSGTGNDTVVFGLEYSCAAIGGTMPVTTTVKSTTTVTAPYGHAYADFPMITPPSGLSTVCGFRLYRNSSATADNFTGDVYAFEVDFHVLRNTLGSRQELTR